MHLTFDDCHAIETLDVSGFDTSKVTTMQSMFFNCYSLENLDVSGFDTRNVTNMRGMFSDCDAMATINVSNFNTSKVTDMGIMFQDCSALERLDVSNFDTRAIPTSGMTTSLSFNVGTGLSGFASGCPLLTEIVLGENFGQSTNMPTEGSSDTGMFFGSSDVNTTVTGTNSVMQSYLWDLDNRIVTF